MDPITAGALLRRYLEGNASQDEIILVERWYQQLVEAGEFSWEEGERESRAGVIERRLLAQIDVRSEAPGAQRVEGLGALRAEVPGAERVARPGLQRVEELGSRRKEGL